jgi:retron-type reverse transcriptase
MAQIGGEAHMKRLGNLWEELTSFENLLGAAKLAAKGKRRRTDVASFALDLEGELVRLRRELIEEGYWPGAYRSFQINDPKPRTISAAPFRDRVVHHALTAVLEPIFERRFSKDSYACRRGFGTHKALERAKEGMRQQRFVLKCDVRQYFASIDHAVLKGLLAGVVKCGPTLRLAGRIVDGWERQDETVHYFPGDTLFTPLERPRGLPLGNQTSQFFANVYLNPLDQFVNRTLRPRAYVRYVDDFLLFGDSKEELREMREAVVGLLASLRLTIHPGKSRVYRAAEGVTFLGWRIFPGRTRLVRENVIRFRRKMRGLQRDEEKGEADWEEITQRVRAWIAHAAYGDTWRLREKLLGEFAFRRGNAI